jgi:hypothetical protein
MTRSNRGTNKEKNPVIEEFLEREKEKKRE